MLNKNARIKGRLEEIRVEWPYAAAQQLYCLKYNVV